MIVCVKSVHSMWDVYSKHTARIGITVFRVV